MNVSDADYIPASGGVIHGKFRKPTRKSQDKHRFTHVVQMGIVGRMREIKEIYAEEARPDIAPPDNTYWENLRRDAMMEDVGHKHGQHPWRTPRCYVAGFGW